MYFVILYYSQEGSDGKDHIRVGKLNLVDLAGSERQSKTGSSVLDNYHTTIIYYLLI